MWDLHVHTPASIVHNYGGQDPWDRYLAELAALPAAIEVIGINDYWFLDGYKKVRAAFDRGDLPNLREIFPVIEVRCDTFGGTEGELSRLNLHLICDPLLPVKALEDQLRPLMKATYQLTDDDEPTPWSQFPTRESLSDLGRQIIESTPQEKREGFRSELDAGFSNLNVSFEDIRKGVESNSLLRGRIALTVGKAEWSAIKWTQQPGLKKHLINSVAAAFSASPFREQFKKNRQSLSDANVRARLLHCSDAHNWTDSKESNRLGNCFTWINADPTFKGLVQALQEYDSRICIEDRPPVLTRIAQAPRAVIAEVSIGAVDGNTAANLFATRLLINPGFAVVIGNKGQGKSALLDAMALAANSDRQDDFSFLSAGRFRSGGGRTAEQYEVELTWEDGFKTRAGLNDGYDKGISTLVDYLPQSLIEKVCAADPDSTEKRHFESEIERVLFRHIPQNVRGTATTLSQHLHAQGHEQRVLLENARNEISAVAKELMQLTIRRDELVALGLPQRRANLLARRQGLTDMISVVEDEIESAADSQQQETVLALAVAVKDRETTRQKVDANERADLAVSADIDAVEGLLSNLRETVEDARALSVDIATRIMSTPESILQVTLSEVPVSNWAAKRGGELDALRSNLESDGGLREQLRVALRKVADLEAELASSGDEVHRLQQQRDDLRAQLAAIDGDASNAETISGVDALATELADSPARLAALEASLEGAFRSVHKALRSVMDLQKAAYEPATEYITNSELAGRVGLAFDVEFRVRNFVNSWIGMVNRQKLGDFYDVEQHTKDRAVLGNVVLSDPDALFANLKALIDRLSHDRGAAAGDPRPLAGIMRSGREPHDLLAAIYSLSWLESQYVIRSEGKELSELSPGQRGLVLLLFYLLIDTSERPLLLDQPEENLDNETVRTALVPAIREATTRRQVIAVTHNPNLAVVGDADQIVVASAKPTFTYDSGSLADLPVGLAAINVLEGTRAAFTTRELRYEKVVGR